MAAVVAVALAGIGLATSSKGAVNTVVVPWSPPPPTADQVAAARAKACELWGRTASVMDGATNAVAHTPGDWNTPAVQDALANEARVTLVEREYLYRELPANTPVAIRSGINDYMAASVDMENATAHRKGTARDAAIDRANAAEGKVNAACR
ncbi:MULTISPECIES: hypothetical protein [Mycobacterium]|nr:MULTISPECIES: hypothetical protein [Mycobacterium]MCA2276685.1 hypothetical protein [Mycobacterium intracellulare]MCA2322873.1 hypothetical protein [Mycobacterium intracellulare]MCA2328366.1 hypothetical protein [Mycobacterium intracellulare]MCA2343684.1 hypothetical protein [Mycobacterium intracellulare]MEA1163165.1 hypothetical protein [Mycobacterium europaeum]